MKKAYIEALREIKGGPRAQYAIYTSEPTELKNSTPMYLIYYQEEKDTFDVEFNLPIVTEKLEGERTTPQK